MEIISMWSDEEDLPRAKKVKRASDALSAACGGISEYEVERERRLKENRDFLAKIGIAPKIRAAADERKKSMKKKEDRESSPIDTGRLSRRLRGERPEAIRFIKSQSFMLGNSDEDLEDANNENILNLRRDPVVVGVPFTLGSNKTTIWELGKIVNDPMKRELYWSQKGRSYMHQYPVGFKAKKKHFDREWEMTITESSLGPVFTVKTEGGSSYVGNTPSKPWMDVYFALFGKETKTRVSGPYLFGFTDPFLQAILLALDPFAERPEETDRNQLLQQVSVAARRGVRFGERKPGRPKKYFAEPLANWMDRAIKLGAVEVLTSEGDVKAAKNDDEVDLTAASGRPRRKSAAAVLRYTFRDSANIDKTKPAISKRKYSDTGRKGEPMEIRANGRAALHPTVSGGDSAIKLEKRRASFPAAATFATGRVAKKTLKKPSKKSRTKSLPLTTAHVEIEADPEVLDCICTEPTLDDGSLLISCDSCNQWFHMRCIDFEDQLQNAADGKKPLRRSKRKSIVDDPSALPEMWICSRCL